jgi:hypothetical protein
MKTATGVAIAWLAGSLLVCGGSGAAQSPSPDTKPSYADGGPIPQDKEVTVAVDGTSIRVKSNDALIHVGRPIRWVARGLRDGATLEIDFEVYYSHHKSEHYVKGPFPRREKYPPNPYRGRFVLDEKNTAVDSADADEPGYFKYHVVLRDRGGRDLAALDPGIIVKNDY